MDFANLVRGSEVWGGTVWEARISVGGSCGAWKGSTKSRERLRRVGQGDGHYLFIQDLHARDLTEYEVGARKTALGLNPHFGCMHHGSSQ